MPLKLNELVQDHFAILKVGPWLTFAFREAVFALAQIERELISLKQGLSPSNTVDIIDMIMVKHPEHWQHHYRGNPVEVALAMKYSLSDRIRYYWPRPEIEAALKQLIRNLDNLTVPLTLLSQYMPEQYAAVRNGEIRPRTVELIHNKIQEVLGIYATATNQKRTGNLK